MHRVREAVRLPQRPGGSVHIYGKQEGQQGHERVAVIQVRSILGQVDFKYHYILRLINQASKYVDLRFVDFRAGRRETSVKKPVDEVAPRPRSDSLDNDDSSSVRTAKSQHLYLSFNGLNSWGPN